MYSNKQKAAMVKALRAVAKELEAENDFICILTERSWAGTQKARAAVVRLIQDRLGDRNTLEGWVVYNLPESHWKDVLVKMSYGGVKFGSNYSYSAEQMRQYRLRWVEELIRELS